MDTFRWFFEALTALEVGLRKTTCTYLMAYLCFQGARKTFCVRSPPHPHGQNPRKPPKPVTGNRSTICLFQIRRTLDDPKNRKDRHRRWRPVLRHNGNISFIVIERWENLFENLYQLILPPEGPIA